MEGLLKLALANQQPGQSSTELVNNSEAQKEPWFSHPSKARTPGHHTFSSNLDPVSTTPVESSQALDFALPRPEGKQKPGMCLLNLISFSVHCCCCWQP